MAQDLKAKEPINRQVITVTGPMQVKDAIGSAKALAAAIGFTEAGCEEIALAVAELASNLVKHAGGGQLLFEPLVEGERTGMQIVSEDLGPGIADIERAVTDGYSTAGSLGTGLGAVNRLMDKVEFQHHRRAGLRIVCQRWVRPPRGERSVRWLDFGAATRPCRSLPENGDAIVIRQWAGHALAGVIDGLGHGQFAQQAAQTTRHYVEQHFDQPLDCLFRGTAWACRATRGVVMALVRFELTRHKLQVASVGNVEVHLVGNPEPWRPIIRRGVLGISGTPEPVVTEHSWTSASLLLIHSDGIRARWQQDAFPIQVRENAGVIARRLLEKYGRTEDDATVVVGKNALQ